MCKFIWLSDGAFGFSVRARIARIFRDMTKQEVEKVSLFAENGPSSHAQKSMKDKRLTKIE